MKSRYSYYFIIYIMSLDYEYLASVSFVVKMTFYGITRGN
jgi:hypothetical protein